MSVPRIIAPPPRSHSKKAGMAQLKAINCKHLLSAVQQMLEAEYGKRWSSKVRISMKGTTVLSLEILDERLSSSELRQKLGLVVTRYQRYDLDRDSLTIRYNA